MAAHGVKLDTLKDCLQFLEWLHSDKDMQYGVTRRLERLLEKRYEKVKEQPIAKALSQFLAHTSNFYKKLCHKAGQGEYKPGKPRDALYALLLCIPRLLAVMYFLRYQVDDKFDKVGGGKWAGNAPGWGVLGRSFEIIGGELDKYLHAQSTENKYGVIPGGFTKGDIQRNKSYAQGSLMAGDLEKICEKQNGQLFRDVFVISVLSKTSGADTANVANALRLVEDFYGIFRGVTGEKDFTSDLQSRDNCISWRALKDHCIKSKDPLEKIFKKHQFSFTGYAQRYEYLNKEKIASKMAKWLQKNLGDVRSKLKGITPQVDAKTFATTSLFPYGFTFYDSDFKKKKNPYQAFKKDWDTVIGDLQKDNGDLAKLKDILDGNRCANGQKKKEPKPKPKAKPTPDAGSEPAPEPEPEPGPKHEDEPEDDDYLESDVDSDEDLMNALSDEESEATKTEAAKPVVTKTEATKTDDAEPTANQGKKAEGAQNQDKNAEHSSTALQQDAHTQSPGAPGSSSGQGTGDQRSASDADQGSGLKSQSGAGASSSLPAAPGTSPGGGGGGGGGESGEKGDGKAKQGAVDCPPKFTPVELWQGSGKYCIRDVDYKEQGKRHKQWDEDLEKTQRNVQERIRKAEDKLRRQKEAEERIKEDEKQRMEEEEREKEKHRQLQREAMLPEIDVYKQQDGRLFDIGENDKSNFHQFFRNDLNVRGEVIRESPDVTLEIMHPTVPAETEEEELPNYPMPQSSQPLSPPTVDGSAVTSNSDNFIRPDSPAKAFSAISITPTGFDGQPVVKQIPKRNHSGANKRLRQYLTKYADVETSVIEPIKLTHKPKHIMVEGHTTPNSKGVQRSMPPEFFASIGIPQGQPLKPSDTRVYMPPKTDMMGQATADSKGIQNFAVPQGSAAIGIPMGYTIKDPKTPTRSTIHLLPAPKLSTKPIRMKPTGIAMPAHKHPPILRHAPITTETSDDPSMARFLNVSGTSLTKSSKANAKAPVLQEIDPPVPQSMLSGSHVPDAELPSSPLPRDTFLTEPQPTMGFQIEFPKRTVRNVEPEIGLSIEVAHHGDRTINDIDLYDPYANTADIIKDELRPAEDKGFSGLPQTNFDLNFAPERIGLEGYDDPGMPRDSPRKADERVITPFGRDECLNPWSVDPSSTDTAPVTHSPSPATDHLPPPQTVREMLCWFVGLSQYGLIGVVTEHVYSLLRELNKDTSHPTDAIEVTGDPGQLTASMVIAKLTEACLYSATVIYKVRHNNDFKAFSTFDFKKEYSQLHYAADPACLLCQLRDYVYACHHQLEFLKAQCSRAKLSGGWRDCHYGSDITASEYPLQAFLTDGWDSDFETHLFDPCNLCLKSRVRMGFRMEDLPEKSQLGSVISSILTPSCGGEDPLLRLSSYLNCLTKIQGHCL
ncbi:hypothetical protein BBBOND_0111330 [Babesia bigemina]|uniref:Ribosome-binding protein 1 n=1 Tax=Babesia bigemina TaxID=5866 RepID=A0A061DAV3_BABBI|nr:hypothetical protein BBBOND_0111330 [Babesia bigemina]CDR94835.1 hypothetical protein BBBOND_0111330 [Babesia bigemina]|eukprot:XP_012767021.1 hypothetical protein BBBOND_0111330 [Babesia bigemina]